MFKNIAYIVNPASQNGATGRSWPLLQARLPRGRETTMTARQGDAIVLAQRAAEGGAELVVSVGGDGTLNEVVTGLMRVPEAKRPAVALVPRGTGGDFRKTLGVPLELSAVSALIERGATRAVDVGRIQYENGAGAREERHFINICSFGLGGAVDYEVNRATKALGGRMSFLLGTLKALRGYQHVEIELSLDDGPFVKDKVLLIAVCNGRLFGGGMNMAPTADPSDGIFEVVTIGDVSTFDKLTKMWRVYFGSHLGMKGVRHQRAKKVTARAGSEALIDLDGEQPGRLPLEIELVPSALRFVC